MRVTGSDFDDAGQWFLKVEKPNDQFQTWYLVNGPVGIGEDQKAIIVEQFPCYGLYDASESDPTFDQYWGAKDGEWKLFKNRDGFQVLGNPKTLFGDDSDTPTTKRILVRQHKVTMLIGKLGGSISAGGTQSATVWIGAGGSESSSGSTVTLRDWFIPSGKSIASGTKIEGHLINGVWYLSEAGACPT